MIKTKTITTTILLLILSHSISSARSKRIASNDSNSTDPNDLWGSENSIDCTDEQCDLVSYKDNYQETNHSESGILNEFDIIDDDLMMVDPDLIDERLFVHKGKTVFLKV
jgi:hypothetical protein